MLQKITVKGRVALQLDQQDEKYMRMALSLAEMGKGQTSPNPVVGAVLVNDHRIVGFGAHLKAGKAHAEVHALTMAGPEAKGSTLYVTLEPCAHYGKTPPCADAVVAAGVNRVVVAVEDPFSKVAGQGIVRMREAGLQVDVGCLQEEAQAQNAAFLHYARTGLPFVTVKLAATLDGMIATNTGDSFYVTGEASRTMVHELRDQVDVVLVGVKTVLADNPRLTVRLVQGGKNPVRAVLDTNLQTPLDAQVLSADAPTILFCGPQAPKEAQERLINKGAVVVRTKMIQGRLDLVSVLQHLAAMGFLHVLVEGGATAAGSFLQSQLASEIWMFHAPKLLGSGISAIGEQLCVQRMQESITLKNVTHKVIGDDLLTIGTPVYHTELL